MTLSKRCSANRRFISPLPAISCRRKRKPCRQACEASELELRVVVVADIVEPNDFLAPVEQPLRDEGADEAGGAGDEYAHFRPSLSPGEPTSSCGIKGIIADAESIPQD
jgi:hypothetical protein